MHSQILYRESKTGQIKRKMQAQYKAVILLQHFVI